MPSLFSHGKAPLWTQQWITPLIEVLSCCIAITVGAFIGWASFGHPDPLVVFLAVFFPLNWIRSEKRIDAWLFAFGYYLAVARGIPSSAAVFFSTSALAPWSTALWIVSSFFLSLPWAIFWAPQPSLWRVFLAFFASSIPPLATFGWASPLMAAGWFFPGGGWPALILFVVIIWLSRRLPLLLVCFAVLFIPYGLLDRSPKIPLEPLGWGAIQTHYGKVASGSAVFTDQFIRSCDLFDKVLSKNQPYILVPETVAGRWTPAAEELWYSVGEQLKQSDQTLVIGAEIFDTEGRYDNVLMFLGTDTPRPYRQRMPVPLSMWIPWGKEGSANAYWFDDGIVTLADGRRAAVLLCYEQYLSWPFLRSMMGPRPDLLITAGNQWWSDETIQAIEHQSAVSWARLFGLPLVSAVNK